MRKALPALTELNLTGFVCAPHELEGLIPDGLRVRSIDELLSKGVDAVYIATPVATHVSLARSIDRPVLLEKPLAPSIDDAAKMSPDDRRRTWMAFKKRFSVAAREAKRARGEGRSTGRISYIWHVSHPGATHWKAHAPISGGGVLMDIGSHVLDLFEHVMGRIDRIQAVTSHNGAAGDCEDRARLDVDFVNGGSGTADLAWIIGAEQQGFVYSDMQTAISWRRDTIEDLVQVANAGHDKVLTVDPVDEYRALFAQFSLAVVGRPNDCPTFADGLRNLRCIDAAYRSARGCADAVAIERW